MDVRTALLWGRLLALRRTRSSSNTSAVIPPGWQQGGRLSEAMAHTVRAHGFPSWRRFAGTVRLAHVIGARAPVSVARRDGRFTIASACAADWQPAGWTLRESPDVTEGPVTSRPVSSKDRPPWLAWGRDAAIALDGQAGSVERRTAASRLSLLGEDPHWRVSAPSCADPVLRWAVSLLLAIRTYRPNTVRTWLMRLARIGDTGRLDQLVGAGVTQDGTLVMRAILASCRSVETMLATRGHGPPGGDLLRDPAWLARGQGRLAAGIPRRDGPGWADPDPGARRDPGRDHGAPGPGRRRGGPGDRRDPGRAGRPAAGRGLPPGDQGRNGGCPVDHSHPVQQNACGTSLDPSGDLAPAWALEMLDRYAARRVAQRASATAWLLRGGRRPWDPDVLGPRVRAALRQVTRRPVTFHALRRSCATWWLVRWFEAAGYGVPADLGTDGPPRAGVQRVLGEDPATILWSLARLLGHSFPVVTLTRYGQAVEWIEAQLGLRSADVTIPGPLAAEILDVSERWARQLVEHTGGTVLADELLEAVVRRLGPVEGSQ